MHHSVLFCCGLAALAACGSGPGGGSSSSSSSGTAGPGSSSGSGVGSSSSGEDVRRCGGSVGLACQPNEYCFFLNHGCGQGDRTGECVTRPSSCTDALPVQTCGCDGTYYASVCDAYAHGVDSAASGCDEPPNTFPCGTTFCTWYGEYCRHGVSDVVGVPDTYWCVALPPICASAAYCQCLEDQPCGQHCEGLNGRITVHCGLF